jgi:hypothetical protein
MSRRRSALLYLVLPLLAAGIALLVIGASMHVRAAPRSPAELSPLAVQPASTGHAPSRFHRVYPPATQHARDWLWRGLGDKQFACLDSLWHFESGWRVKAGTPEGSFGIPQAFPGTRMASAGPDWRTNPMTQVRWGLRYIGAPGFGHGRYGSPCKAWAFWRAHGWY